ncbi:YqeB family protein [Kribbella deserti]|uniref:Uncharacterized protein n=1 Tax=Kribbella deserti TaxID=1926257 RepID=A0ABV6QIR5_9ACTN
MNSQRQTVIGHSTVDKLVLYGGLPVVGLVLGYFLPRIADWAMTQKWLPKGPLRFIAEWDAWWVVGILMLAGLIGGLLLAAVALEDSLKVTVTDTEVELLKNTKTQTVRRSDLALAFLDGKELVLQDATSRELAREKHDQLASGRAKFGPAFRQHGYAWSEDGDPHANAFSRWIEDHPDVPPAVNAVLKARAKAIAAGDKGKADVREFRQEVGKLGYVVRDEHGKQYIRAIKQA